MKHPNMTEVKGVASFFVWISSFLKNPYSHAWSMEWLTQELSSFNCEYLLPTYIEHVYFDVNKYMIIISFCWACGAAPAAGRITMVAASMSYILHDVLADSIKWYLISSHKFADTLKPILWES